jgi:hypothetical protein
LLPSSSTYAEVQFRWVSLPREVIVLAVRWYLRYGLSYRDVEELLAERGINVDHVTIYRWVQRFTSLLIDAARHLIQGTNPRSSLTTLSQRNTAPRIAKARGLIPDR